MKPASDVVDLVMPPRGHRPADRASGAADASEPQSSRPSSASSRSAVAKSLNDGPECWVIGNRRKTGRETTRRTGSRIRFRRLQLPSVWLASAMSDNFAMLVDVDATPSQADGVARAVLDRFRNMGVISGDVTPNCVLGGIAYRPGDRV